MRITCFHMNQVGDLLFSLPALKCIRDGYPDAAITSVVRPGSKELLEATGLADVVIPRPKGLNLAKLRLVGGMVSEHCDLAVSFSQSFECGLLNYLTGAPRRVGFANAGLARLLTHRVGFQKPPSTANNLRLVAALGLDLTKRDYVGLLKPTEAAVAGAGRLLARHSVDPDVRIAALAPGTSDRRRVKEWTDEGFAAVGRHLLNSGFQVIVLGVEPAQRVVELCPGITDLSGKTDLGEAVAILSRCRMLVAVDSGILHLAAAAGTNVVGLYGPSNPQVTGPQGDGHVVVTSGAQCSPCLKRDCSLDRKCMLDIAPEDVIAAVDSVLACGV